MDRKTRQGYQSLSKFLEYVLGNAPDEFGLVLDPEGWAPLKEVVQVLAEEREWKGTNQSRIRDLQWALTACPFEMDEKRIRLNPTLGKTSGPPARYETDPPPILHYGCRRRPYRTYMTEGMRTAQGHEIILSRSKDLALRIARRRDSNPILVEVHTTVARSKGCRFVAYGERLFLAEWLSVESLVGPPVKEEPEKRQRKAKKQEQPEPLSEAPHPDSFRSKPWVPSGDHALGRTPEEERALLRRQRSEKRVGWKEDLRKGKRRGKPER